MRMISCGKWAPLKLIAIVALPLCVLDHLSGRAYPKGVPNETCDRTCKASNLPGMPSVFCRRMDPSPNISDHDGICCLRPITPTTTSALDMLIFLAYVASKHAEHPPS